MYAEVILARRVPSRFDSFTYAVPEGKIVKPGTLVQVPFRKQTLSGIVRSIHRNQPVYPTKALTAVLPMTLPERQLELAEWMTLRYCTSFAKCMNLFIPEKIWTDELTKVIAPTFSNQYASAFGRSEAGQMRLCARREREQGEQSGKLRRVPHVYHAASASCEPKRALIIERTLIDRKKFYGDALKNLSAEGQALILLPEHFHLEACAPDYPRFHGGLKEKEKAEFWKSVAAGNIRVIAGTRPALFLPFRKLEIIILDFEESESFREQRQPAYHVFDVAEKLSEIWGASLTVLSAAPRTETWWKMKSEILNPKSEKKSEIHLVDMADERRSGNYGIFSQLVVEKTAAALAKGNQALFFINQKGQAGALLCTDCKNISRCENCASTLTVHGDSLLQCHRCKIQKESPLQCEKCGNPKLKTVGFGTERLEKDIKKIFGNAKVFRLERNKKNALSMPSAATATSAAELSAGLDLYDIIIATKIIEKPISLPKLDLVVAVNPDPLLQFPDFRAGERLFQILSRLRLLGKNCIIQTFMATHPLFQYFASGEIEKFYEEELAARKSLNLPPFEKTGI